MWILLIEAIVISLFIAYMVAGTLVSVAVYVADNKTLPGKYYRSYAYYVYAMIALLWPIGLSRVDTETRRKLKLWQ